MGLALLPTSTFLPVARPPLAAFAPPRSLLKFKVRDPGPFQIRVRRKLVNKEMICKSSLAGSLGREFDSNGRQGGSLAAALNWAPRLKPQEEAACVAAAITSAGLAWWLTRSAGVCLPAFAIACLFAGVLITARSSILEGYYQAKCCQVTELGDADSRFPLLENIRVHAKSCLGRDTQVSRQAAHKQEGNNSSDGRSTALLAVHCYHGFGANLYSWGLSQKLLADALKGLVTSHDMPGFGLTERPKDVSSYVLAFNGRLGQLVQDHELQRLQLLQTEPAPGLKAGPLAKAEGDHEQLAAMGARGESLDISVGTGPAGLDPDAASSASASSTSSSFTSKSSGTPQQLGDASAGSGAGSRASSYDSGAHRDSQPQLQPQPLQGQDALLGGAGEGSARGNGDGGGLGGPAVKAQHLGVPVARVFCGHSLGGICAALQALQATTPGAPAGLASPAGGASQQRGHSKSGGSLPRADAAARGWHAVGASALVLVAPAILAGGSGGSGGGEARLERVTEPLRAQPPQRQAAGSNLGHEGHLGTLGSNVRRYVNQQDSGRSTASSAAAAAASAQASATTAAPGKRVAGALLTAAVSLARGMLLLAVLLTLQACRPMIIGLLRVLVRSPGFWIRGLSQAYYDPKRLTQQLVDAYRLPSLVRGWETGMFLFLLARLANTSDVGEWARSGVVTTLRRLRRTCQRALGKGDLASKTDKGLAAGDEDEDLELKGEQNLTARLCAAAKAGTLPPVLIIHGEGDRLVPLSNSIRLAKMLPGAELAVVEQCGHQPMEEWPHTFTSLVSDFLDRRVAQAGAAASA